MVCALSTPRASGVKNGKSEARGLVDKWRRARDGGGIKEERTWGWARGVRTMLTMVS